MLLVKTVTGVRARREELARRGARLAFVPTMGALHDGHLSLVTQAASLADEVWASVFVNPTQFAPGEDLEAYPRRLEEDRQALERAGVALLFAPDQREIYPRPTSLRLTLPALTGGLCGAHRKGHFEGVMLVVAKLLAIVQPHVAVFGAKDFQQVAVIRRMVEDLSLPVEVVVAPTVRDGDGVAMSSRNAYLSPEERDAARVVPRALHRAAAAIAAGERNGTVIQALLAATVEQETLAQLQYAAAVDPETLRPIGVVSRRVLLALAVHVGGTRLIDNLLVEVS